MPKDKTSQESSSLVVCTYVELYLLPKEQKKPIDYTSLINIATFSPLSFSNYDLYETNYKTSFYIKKTQQ